MKRVMCAALLTLGCTVAAAAQSGMSGDKMAKDKMAKDADKSVMVTGCVAESGGKFMLNNAMMADHAGSGMAPGAAMTPGSPMSYMLSGGSLKPHVGHKVEVTGMMKPMAKEAMGKDKMGKDKMGKDDMSKDGMMKKESMDMAGTVTVKDVKMIAATCS